MTFDGCWVMNIHRTPFAGALLTLLVCALFPNVATAQYSVAQCALVGQQRKETAEVINKHLKVVTELENRQNKIAAELRDGCRTKEVPELRNGCQTKEATEWINKRAKEALDLSDKYQKEVTELTKQRQKIISLGRENLSYCRGYMNRDVYIANFEALAFDLNYDKQPEEALGVANRCLEIDARDLSCLTDKAIALISLGRPSEATSIVDRASSLGAITEVEALAKKRLQEAKLLLHHKTEMSRIYSNPAEVTLKKDGGTFVVPVLINGAITLDFTFDSGAADVIVPADVFSTLVRTGTISEADITGEQTYVLADGSKGKSVTFTIRSLKVGDKLVENVRGSVAPAQGSLLLGQSFLEHFKSWSFNHTKHQLVLECVECEQATTRPVAAIGPANPNKKTEPVPRWGMQITADWSESKAWAIYRMIQKQYAAVIGDLEPITILSRDVEGGRVRYNIRIANDDRAYLEKLCIKLIAAGGACVVLRNDKG